MLARIIYSLLPLFSFVLWSCSSSELPSPGEQNLPKSQLSAKAKPRLASPETANQDLLSPDDESVSTIEHALERVLRNNPRLKASLHQLRSTQALVKQAGSLPNPELETEIENWGGNLNGFRESETTISVSQPLLLGGKRRAEKELAGVAQEISKLQRESLARSLRKETQLAYYRLAFAEATIGIEQRQLALSKRVLSLIRSKLAAGAVLTVEQTKAEIGVNNDELALALAESERTLARENLAALWGGTGENLKPLSGATSLGKSQEYLRPFSVSESPILRLAALRELSAEKKLNMEKALSIPNASLGFGYRRFEESDSNAFLGLASIELPLFNRNQGAIEGALELQRAAKLDKQSKEIETRTLILGLQTSLRTGLFELRSIRANLTPLTARAFREAEEAYHRGRTSYLELLDAQRTWIESLKREEELLLAVRERQAQIQEHLGENLFHSDNGEK